MWRFLCLWPLSLSAGAVSGAVCRRRDCAGGGALYIEKDFRPLIAALRLWLLRVSSSIGRSRNKRARPRRLQQLGQRLFQGGQNRPSHRDGQAWPFDCSPIMASLISISAISMRRSADSIWPNRHFEETLRLYPNYAEAHSNLGQLLPSRAISKAAFDEFRQAIELNPSLERAALEFRRRARSARADRRGRPQRCRKLHGWRRNRPRPTIPWVAFTPPRAVMTTRRKRLKRLCGSSGDFAAAHQSLAQLLSLQGKKEEALRALPRSA